MHVKRSVLGFRCKKSASLTGYVTGFLNIPLL